MKIRFFLSELEQLKGTCNELTLIESFEEGVLLEADVTAKENLVIKSPFDYIKTPSELLLKDGHYIVLKWTQRLI